MKKVVIGMSGGVDSSVAAYLLKEQGYEVVGLFMRNWDTSINNDILGNPYLNNDICTQEQDYNDALKVCEELNIPLHRIDFVKEYWDYVFTYFLDELKRGRTPNPDIMCNKYIKFDSFVKEAIKLGADYIATGHYAIIENGKLLRGIDNNKDQTYFLSQLSNKQLENVLFPVGNLEKHEVREIATKMHLNTAEKKDSTGICFIGERNFKEFLSNYLPHQPGKIVNIENNEILGVHVGLMYYTIGQRKGLEIGGSAEKIYVVGKNLKDNILYVANGEDNEYLFSDQALIEDVNWISKEHPLKCSAKFRYRQQDQAVELEYIDDKHIMVKYNRGKSVTPGQACVFYLGDECLGGGTIKEIYKDNTKLWYL
ncbi:MAG: tRNA 2-thiouridine(34) synthase MnmA [Bacilli bacterium]|nr:tRNA 2-thiouridine(34) synthase MnmA [Bacilli bacterium]MDD3305364.1 tRNA 2-thiouridine(34) synthase MnmA [Bacilli bacterium]MDD4054049.1 tRNA 2-thiouridine(34) synthase MnmA [Bacilli bacterium]MDD4411819.1 tRNA 2-thiouridine(34) synthase MnmA [Bacilli bacterium]